MGDNEKQIGVKVDESLWQEFREDVQQRRGSVKGHLKTELHNALREYINAAQGGDTHDRLIQIESRLNDIEGAVAEIGETKKDSGVSKTVENRLASIRETIQQEAGEAPRVHEQVVEMAIKRHAGQSKPTLRQYKELLKDNRELFQDPRTDQSYYYREAPQYCAAVNQMYQDQKISKSDYLHYVENVYERDWWGAQVDKFNNEPEADGGSVGFQ